MMRKMIRNLCDDCKECECNNNSLLYCFEVCGIPIDILKNTEKERNDKALERMAEGENKE